MTSLFTNVDETAEKLHEVGYLADDDTAVSAFLACSLERPLLVEGPPGVGKTELAKALCAASGRVLIRLQCYEGLDESRALYEWEYAKQILYAQLLRESVRDELSDASSLSEAIERLGAHDAAFFDERFLIERPLLASLRSEKPALLLVDEVDRADPELEALLLEVLSDYSASIPELGTLRATQRPWVILTSNGTRELSEALRRRCLYLHLDLPDFERELAIVRHRLPDVSQSLQEEAVAFVQRVRTLPLDKAPSLAETLDWVRTLSALGIRRLGGEESRLRSSLGALAKKKEDLELIEREL